MSHSGHRYILIMQFFRVIYHGNFPLVTCVICYTHKPSGEYVYQENTSDEWDNPQFYHDKGVHNFFTPCHRKYNA